MKSRTGGRLFIVLPLVVVLVLGVLVVVDRIVHARVEEQVSRNLQGQMQLSGQPEVTIHGFPFITQLAMGRFSHVDFAGNGITAGTPERPLKVERIELVLTDVVTEDNYRRITATELDGTAYVTWAEISRQVGAKVTPQEGGRVRVDLTAALFGQQADIVLSARPVLDVATQEVRLVEPRVLIARYRVPDAVVERIAAEYAPPVPIVLPLSLRASSLTIGSDHLELGLTGSNVTLVG